MTAPTGAGKQDGRQDIYSRKEPADKPLVCRFLAERRAVSNIVGGTCKAQLIKRLPELQRRQLCLRLKEFTE